MRGRVPIIASALAVLVLAGAALAAVRMTGYGATRKAWAAHHVRDPNPRLDKGCCYLPKQADGTDRYYAVNRDERGRVFNYSMHFAPRVSATFARLLLGTKELPSDARLIRNKRSSQCLLLEYRSAAAKHVLGSAIVGVAFYSSVSGRYTGTVQDVSISAGVTTSAGC